MSKHTITKRRYSKTFETTFFLLDSFRPLATSTPYEIAGHQRPLLAPPICCSTPKQTRRPPPTSLKRKISQRRLQFTTNSNNESKRMTIKNIKIWLL
jgi:hypothetical protein